MRDTKILAAVIDALVEENSKPTVSTDGNVSRIDFGGSGHRA